MDRDPLLIPSVPVPGIGVLPPMPMENDAWLEWVPQALAYRIAARADAENPSRRPLYRAACQVAGGLGHIYWLTVFCTIKEPRNPQRPVSPFLVYPRQAELIFELHDLMRAEPGARSSLAGEKAREVGFTWIDASHNAWCWQFEPYFTALVISQKKDDVDDPKNDASWMPKVRHLLKSQPAWFLPKGFSWDKDSPLLHISNPETGSLILGTSTTPDAGRSGRYTKVSFDEANFNDEFAAQWNSCAAVTHHRVAYSSASLEHHSDFYDLVRGRNGWTKPRVFVFSSYDVPGRDEAWHEAKRAEMHEDDFRREYLIDYRAGTGDWVYPGAQQKEPGNYPFRPGYPLYVLIDDGYDDHFAIVWVQHDPETGRYRVIGGYANRKQPISFYGYLLKGVPHGQFDWSEHDKAMMAWIRERNLWEATFYGDRHGDNTDLSSGKSPFQVLSDDFGITVIPVSHPDLVDLKKRRDALANLLPKLDFDSQHGAPNVLEALKNNRYPKRASTSQATTETREAIHDWTSHFTSCLEYGAQMWRLFGGQSADDASGPLPKNTFGGGFDVLAAYSRRRRRRPVPTYEEDVEWIA